MEPYWGNIGNIKDSQALIFTHEPVSPVGARDFVVPSRMNPGPLGFALQEVLKEGLLRASKTLIISPI